jgi:hypothetical protein
MDTEEQKQEQPIEETPAFFIKESAPSEADITIPPTDVVEIPETKEEEKLEEAKTPEEEGKAPPEVKEEKKEDEPLTPPVVEDKKEEEPEILDLDEELAFNYLKDKKGLKYDSLEDFLNSKEAKKDPEYEKYQEYKTKTGRGYSDFLETQRDWSKESPETLVKAALKIENPELSNEDIDFLFEKDYTYDEEIDSDFDIKSKQIILKVDAKKALSKLEKQQADYLVERGSEDDNVPEVYKEAKDLVDRLYDEQTENEEKTKTLRNDFVSKTESTLNDNFEGFEFNIDGQKFLVKPEDIKKTREAQLDIANFQKKFFDKGEKLADTKGYHKSLFAAMDPDKLALHFFNLGKTTYAENLEKESKNIDVKGEKHIPEPSLETFTFKKVN